MNNNNEERIYFVDLLEIYRPKIEFVKNIKIYKYKAIIKGNVEIRFTVFNEINKELEKYLEKKKLPYIKIKEKKGFYKSEYDYLNYTLPQIYSNYDKSLKYLFYEKRKIKDEN